MTSVIYPSSPQVCFGGQQWLWEGGDVWGGAAEDLPQAGDSSRGVPPEKRHGLHRQLWGSGRMLIVVIIVVFIVMDGHSFKLRCVGCSLSLVAQSLTHVLVVIATHRLAWRGAAEAGPEGRAESGRQSPSNRRRRYILSFFAFFFNSLVCLFLSLFYYSCVCF